MFLPRSMQRLGCSSTKSERKGRSSTRVTLFPIGRIEVSYQYDTVTVIRPPLVAHPLLRQYFQFCRCDFLVFEEVVEEKAAVTSSLLHPKKRVETN